MGDNSHAGIFLFSKRKSHFEIFFLKKKEIRLTDGFVMLTELCVKLNKALT